MSEVAAATQHYACSDRAVFVAVVSVLTIIWWGATIFVTVILKATLGQPDGLPHSLMDDGFSYPYPFAITLMSNIGTAILCGLLHLGWEFYSSCGSCTSVCGHAAPAVESARSSSPSTPLVDAPQRRQAAGVEAKQNALQSGFQWLVERDYAMFVVMGFLQGLSIAAKNKALLLLSVSKRTMIFAMNVIVVMLFARLFGLEKLGKEKLAAASLLIVGGVFQEMATWSRMQADAMDSNEPQGCALAAAALVMDALKWVFLQAVLTKKEEPVPEDNPSDGGPALVEEPPPMSYTVSGQSGQQVPVATDSHRVKAAEITTSKSQSKSKFRAVAWVMIATVPVCAAMVGFFEPEALPAAQQSGSNVFGRIAALSVGVAAINVAEFGLVEWTSAVTFNVLANLHSIPIVFAGVVLFAEEVVALEMVGFVACVVSALVYSWAKEREKQKLLEHQAQPLKDSDPDALEPDLEPYL